MTVKINFKNHISNKNSANIVLFTDERFSVKPLKKYISNFEFSYVSDLLKTSDLSKNLFVFEINAKKKIVLVSIKKNLNSFNIENLGAEFYERINYGKNTEYYLFPESIGNRNQNFIDHFLHGIKLKSYKFEKYKTKKKN